MKVTPRNVPAGIGFVPPLWHPAMVNRVERVSPADAKAMAKRLANGGGV
jgi:hypothetical protein